MEYVKLKPLISKSQFLGLKGQMDHKCASNVIFTKGTESQLTEF